jgi:hypothetical protein
MRTFLGLNPREWCAIALIVIGILLILFGSPAKVGLAGSLCSIGGFAWLALERLTGAQRRLERGLERVEKGLGRLEDGLEKRFRAILKVLGRIEELLRQR